MKLPGKPDPALFLEAARRLDSLPERTAVVGDALAGVEAGRRGGFGLVIGVDRTGDPSTGVRLRRHGADIVVSDLGELLPKEPAHDGLHRRPFGARVDGRPPVAGRCASCAGRLERAGSALVPPVVQVRLVVVEN